MDGSRYLQFGHCGCVLGGEEKKKKSNQRLSIKTISFRKAIQRVGKYPFIIGDDMSKENPLKNSSMEKKGPFINFAAIGQKSDTP